MNNPSENNQMLQTEKNEEQETTKQETIKNEFKIFFDSSFLMALAYETDANHKAASAVFDFLNNYNCAFYLNNYVAAETISKLVHKTGTIGKALKYFETLRKKLEAKNPFYTGSKKWGIDEIIKRYKNISKKKLRFLQINDFMIVTEGILLNGIILTCDRKMKMKTKQYYDDLFLIAPESKNYKNDIPDLIEKVIKHCAT